MDHPWQLDVFEDYIYWADVSRGRVERCDKFDCDQVDSTLYAEPSSDDGVLRNIAIVSPSKQHMCKSGLYSYHPIKRCEFVSPHGYEPGVVVLDDDPCASKPCSQICLPSSQHSGYVCRCATGYSINPTNANACTDSK